MKVQGEGTRRCRRRAKRLEVRGHPSVQKKSEAVGGKRAPVGAEEERNGSRYESTRRCRRRGKRIKVRGHPSAQKKNEAFQGERVPVGTGDRG